MNQYDTKEDIGMQNVTILKGEDGMFTATCKESGLPAVKGESVSIAMARMTRAMDEAIKTNKAGGL